MAGGAGHRGGGRRSGTGRGGAPSGGVRGTGQAAAGRRQGDRPARPANRQRPVEPPRDVHDPDGVRLQKVLATAGLGSRRKCEELIAQGRVTVDGVVVRELGVRVAPRDAVIHVDGMRLQLDTSLVTVALNKPAGVVSTMHDPQGRPSLAPFVADRSERLFHVGRLDAETEGLLLLTNDGELANRLAHPTHGVQKTYLATVEGAVRPGVGVRLRRGVELEDGPVVVDSFRVVDSTPGATMVEVVIHEGRNRVVRRMFDAVGHPVTRLVRTQVGPIRLGDLRPGRTRVLGREELGRLMAEVGL